MLAQKPGRAKLDALRREMEAFDPVASETAALIARFLWGARGEHGSVVYDLIPSRERALQGMLGLTDAEARELSDLVRKTLPKDAPLEMDYAGRAGTRANLASREMAEKLDIIRNPGSTFGGIAAGVIGVLGGTASDMRAAAQAGSLLEVGGGVISARGAANPQVTPRAGAAYGPPRTEAAADKAAVRRPIAGATEVTVTQAEYQAALNQVLPSQFRNQVAQAVDSIGQRAAQRAAANPQFVGAVQSGNWRLAGTLFHSAAAQEARALPASALPPGWTLQAERVIQSGAGGSRADLLLTGPAGELVEFDWKTSGTSALTSAARREMARHAGQITTNIGGTLTTQESRSWMDLVRPLMPGIRWP
ncbi:hypothetical protein [Micromonospora sp. DPT]|uniref:hypothetical protein n=1 Tax=Micromonospora sp. DPT TaxID=3142975 RepID=UPI0032099B1C